MHQPAAFQFEGDYYREIGDFLRENYLEYGFTKGTVQEVDFLLEVMNLPPGARVLDVGCGAGRHSLELARRRYRPLGVDISPGLIEVARQAAAKERLDAQFQVGDARELKFAEPFDGAICLCEGAFGLVGDWHNHRKVVSGVYNALRPGAVFVLTAIHALNAARHAANPRLFDPYTCTSAHPDTVRSPEGETRQVTIYTTGFTYRELALMLEEAGFEVLAGYGCIAGNFRRKPLGLDDIEILMIARRP